MNTYLNNGHSYLICPRLLELDVRHGEHWSKHPPCRHNTTCLLDHEHEIPLIDGGGHSVVDFYWEKDCRPPTSNEHPRCSCGAKLIHSDLDDLFDSKHMH